MDCINRYSHFRKNFSILLGVAGFIGYSVKSNIDKRRIEKYRQFRNEKELRNGS